MSDVAVFRAADGTVRVVVPCDPLADLAVVAAKASAGDPALAASAYVGAMPIDAIPSRRFRQSWRIIAGALNISLAAARTQLIAELRAQRDKLLTQSDALRAKYADIGTALDQTKVAAYRQQLRDVTTQIQADLAAMTTVAQLEAYVAPIPSLPAGISL